MENISKKFKLSQKVKTHKKNPQNGLLGISNQKYNKISEFQFF
jgi:hypothetical protein